MKTLEMVAAGVDQIRVVERAEEQLPPGHVRVRSRALSLNYRDLFLAKGLMPIPYPRVPLSDVAGDVIEVGRGVSRFAVGDRVFVTYYPDWISGPIAAWKFARDRAGLIDGVAAETIVVSESELVSIPNHLDYVGAACLPCAGVTAWSSLTQNVNLAPGMKVLIQGTGGVSLFALQFALAAGCETWLISSSDEKLMRAKALGVHHALNYRKTPDWGSVIFEQGGSGMDLVVDVAGSTMAQSVLAVGDNGRISQVGILGGMETTYPIYPLMTKAAHIDGVISGSREAAESMVRAVDVCGIKPVVGEVFSFEMLSYALSNLEKQTHFGKIVLEV